MVKKQNLVLVALLLGLVSFGMADEFNDIAGQVGMASTGGKTALKEIIQWFVGGFLLIGVIIVPIFLIYKFEKKKSDQEQNIWGLLGKCAAGAVGGIFAWSLVVMALSFAFFNNFDDGWTKIVGAFWNSVFQ